MHTWVTATKRHTVHSNSSQWLCHFESVGIRGKEREGREHSRGWRDEGKRFVGGGKEDTTQFYQFVPESYALFLSILSSSQNYTSYRVGIRLRNRHMPTTVGDVALRRPIGYKKAYKDVRENIFLYFSQSS